MKGNVHYVGIFVKSFLTIKKELMSAQYGNNGYRSIQSWTAWGDLKLDIYECARANHLWSMHEAAKLDKLDLCCVSGQECSLYTEMTFTAVPAWIFMRVKFIECQATFVSTNSFSRPYKN